MPDIRTNIRAKGVNRLHCFVDVGYPSLRSRESTDRALPKLPTDFRVMNSPCCTGLFDVWSPVPSDKENHVLCSTLSFEDSYAGNSSNVGFAQL